MCSRRLQIAATASAALGNIAVAFRGEGVGWDTVVVSAEDVALDVPAIQNRWIQGVGCAAAIASCSS